MNKTSITLIIIYFGKWPKWHKFFLESCRKNHDVNFLIFTDQTINFASFPNIKSVKFSLDDFNKLISEKLHIKIEVSDPYKVCDFRPAYGIIFSDYLKDSVFWGHTDIDVIFGNITEFISQEMLTEYDIITARREYLVGHFTIYRNVEPINGLYTLADSYRSVFLAKEYLGFDECNFLWWRLIAGQDILQLRSNLMSMSHLVKKLQADKKIRALFADLVLEQNHKSNSFEKLLIWDHGCLKDYVTNVHFLYFHFHFLKKKNEFECPEWNVAKERFLISRRGFSFEA